MARDRLHLRNYAPVVSTVGGGQRPERAVPPALQPPYPVSTVQLAHTRPLDSASPTFLPGGYLHSFSRRRYPQAWLVGHQLPIHSLNLARPDISTSLLLDHQSLLHHLFPWLRRNSTSSCLVTPTHNLSLPLSIIMTLPFMVPITSKGVCRTVPS